MSAYAPVSGIQKKISASGSCKRVGEHDADLLGCPDAVANLVLEGANPSNTLVASPAVATVDEILDSCAQGTERKRHDERRQRDDPRGVAADDDAEPDRDRRVDGEEQERQRHVDERAIDEAIDRIQPVPHDRDPDRRDERELGNEEERERLGASAAEPAAHHDVEREDERDQRRTPHEPLHLQALDADRAAEAEDDREGAGKEARKDPDGERDPDAGVDDELSDGVAEERVRDVLVRRRVRLWIEQLQSDREREAHDRHAGDPAPAARQEPAVREDERDGERPGEQDRRHGCRLGLVRPRRTDELLRGDLEGGQERSEQEDPRDAVAWELEGDQEADDGWGQDREREERIDRERNPVLLVGGNDLEYLQQADRQRR